MKKKDDGLSAHPMRLEPHICLHRKTVMCSCMWAMCVVINYAKLCLPMNLYTLKYKSIYTYYYMCTTYWTARVTAFEFSKHTQLLKLNWSVNRIWNRYRYRNRTTKSRNLCSGSKINYKQKYIWKKQTNIYIYYIHIEDDKPNLWDYIYIYIYI